jgi:hypothetical protein
MKNGSAMMASKCRLNKFIDDDEDEGPTDILKRMSRCIGQSILLVDIQPQM